MIDAHFADDETDKTSSSAAMKFAMSAAAACVSKSTDKEMIDAHFASLKVNAIQMSFASKVNQWRPTDIEDAETTPQCRLRAKRDIMDLLTDPPPGVYIAPVEHNITAMNALVLGPADTPYEGGFFHFLVQCPPDYPIKPPRVRLLTTGAGRVRFNPNLYECGKVCLSILGTWSGPAWSPAQCIASVLISIQSLLSEKPYHNEPGYEKERAPREVILNTFPDYYDKYEEVVVSNADLTGKDMNDPFGGRRGQFQYKTLLERLRKLKGQVQEWFEATRPDSE
ncbi:hypothetical protein MTO96_040794 [Rhipicephalus appendiculatus]